MSDDWGECIFCAESITAYDAWSPLNAEQYAHHECSVRSVLGGIGLLGVVLIVLVVLLMMGRL